MKFIILFLFPSIISAAIATVEVDGVKLNDEKKIKDVSILTGEKDGTRLYHATFDSYFNGKFEDALNFVTDFTKRCNNSYRKERKFLSKEVECPYHNENLIESQMVRELKKKEQAPGLVDQFVLKRRIWNKGLHTYNDFVTVRELDPGKDEKRVVEVSYRLLDDKESKEFIEDPVPFDNAFHYTVGTYRLIQTKENKILVNYSYVTKTKHWFLTSSMIQGSVLDSMAKGVRLAVDSIQSVMTASITKE
jgi:hypothetical protein